MWRLLTLLFKGHCHEWETLEKEKCCDPDGYTVWRYHLRCKKCGELKVERFG